MTDREAAQLLAGLEDVLLLTHRRPDGDTLGCALALRALLEQAGKTAWLLPNREATALFTPYLEGAFAPSSFAPQHVVAVDIASPSLFPENALPYRDRGIGGALFRLACQGARELGAERLYISAHSAQETMAAYRALGCVEAEEIYWPLARKEPCDVQLEFRL